MDEVKKLSKDTMAQLIWANPSKIPDRNPATIWKHSIYVSQLYNMLSNRGFTRIEFSPTLSTNAPKREDQERASMERRPHLKVTFWSLVEDFSITRSERSEMVCSQSKDDFHLPGSFDYRIKAYVKLRKHIFQIFIWMQNRFGLVFLPCLQIRYDHVQSVQSCNNNKVEIVWCRSKHIDFQNVCGPLVVVA